MGIEAYAKAVNRNVTPQSEPIPGSSQVENSAGGYSFAVDDWKRLDRFLILGSEGGSYYATERALTRENAAVVERLLKVDGRRLVGQVVAVSEAGRAPKNDAAIFALGMALKLGDVGTRSAAQSAVPRVCRIGTHLFQLAEMVQALGGWGRGTKRAFADWYLKKEPAQLAFQLVKYQQRNGWSNRDILKLSHPKQKTPAQSLAFQWALGGDLKTSWLQDQVPEAIRYFEQLKATKSVSEAANIILLSGLPWECVPTELLKEPGIWEALLPKMGLTAMMRNLGRMTSIGLLKPLCHATAVVRNALASPTGLAKARLHPLNLLVAARTYAQGHGVKGNLSWEPVPEVQSALEQAFYLAFQAVEPTNKRYLLGVDVSGSMAGGEVCGTNICPREAAAVMAMVTVEKEPATHVCGFSTTFSPLPFRKGMQLEEAIRITSGLPFSGTDCALPMVYAAKAKLEVDVFVVLTDSETWAGLAHPVQALRAYREHTGIPAKLVVVGMVSNGFSIADPNDAGMLDVVGFDTATPALMADFARG